MAIKESREERIKRFKSMSSAERKALIRTKMKAEGLQEGSGVPGKDLSSYDRDEIWDLIQLTSFFTEIQTKPKGIKSKNQGREKPLIAWILIGIALSIGMVIYYKQYPSPEIRRELSIDVMFAD